MSNDRNDLQDSAALKAHIDSYIVGLHATLWANWYVDAPGRRKLAVEWVVDLLDGLGLTFVGEFSVDNRHYFELDVVA